MNFDSGIMASTFLTCFGLEELRGEMASTASLSKVHVADSLWFLTSSLIGSLDVIPQTVPGQDFSGLSIPSKTKPFFRFFKIIFRNIPVDGELVAADDVELVEGEFVVEDDVVVPEKH